MCHTSFFLIDASSSFSASIHLLTYCVSNNCLRFAGLKSGRLRCSAVGLAVPSFWIWSTANMVNISPEATAAASAVVMCAWRCFLLFTSALNLSIGTVVRLGLTIAGCCSILTISRFRFLGLELLSAMTSCVVLPLELLGLSLPCSPGDVYNSPSSLPPIVESTSVRPPSSSPLGAVFNCTPPTSEHR